MNPFENETWVRMCLKTGAITPPRGYEIERANRITAYAVLTVVTIGAVIVWIWRLW
jgi:hypothetical protein